MKNYAFISKDGILRLMNTEGKAKAEATNGKYLEVDLEYMDGGYPAWDVKDDGKPGKNGVIVYSEAEMKVSARGKLIKPIPELAELYAKLK